MRQRPEERRRPQVAPEQLTRVTSYADPADSGVQPIRQTPIEISHFHEKT